MKVLLIHFRYYVAGGPERYLFNVKQLLEENGHEVVPFSLNYDMNQPSEFQQYFADPIGSKNEFHSLKAQISIKDKLKIFKNYIYNKTVKKAIERIILDTKPDIAYVLSYKGKLSPSVFDACAKYKTPTVLRISEFSLLCLNNIYFRNGNVCRECDKSLFNGVKHKCLNNSLFQTVTNYLALTYFFRKKYPSKINSIICPSVSTKTLFEENKKFKNNCIIHIPTFANTVEYEKYFSKNYSKKLSEKCFVFWGRVAVDKGVDIFLAAIKLLNDQNYKISAKIYGFQDDDYCNNLRNFIAENNLTNVECFPFMNKEKIFENIQDSIASVIPSIWFDNMPNSLIESQAIGIPVIASNFGCFPELIKPGFNGFLFEPKNPGDLALKMQNIIETTNYNELCENAIAWVNNYCSKENHYKNLISEFNFVINGNNK